MFLLCFVFLFSALVFPQISPSPLFVIEDSVYYDVGFYSNFSKQEWDGLSLDKKTSVFNDYLKKELVFFDAKKQGLLNNPSIKEKLLRRYDILLINNTYEHLVARPLVSKKVYLKNKQMLTKQVFVYHILFSFEDSTKEDVFEFALSIKDSISSSPDILLAFQETAFSLSKDPSAKQNRGKLGWLPWGAVVESFQSPVFDLEPMLVSPPILTEFGYHLALVERVSFSDYYYYPVGVYNDLCFKSGLRVLDFDLLKQKASVFDSLLFVESSFLLNDSLISFLFASLEDRKKEDRLFGGKTSLLSWVGLQKEIYKNRALFSLHGSLFGVGWLENKLINTPASRVGSFSSKEDFVLFVESLVLEELVLNKGFLFSVDTCFSFIYDLNKNTKNIVFHEHVSSLINSIVVDSLDVVAEYKEGVFNNNYKNPRRVVVSEIKLSTLTLAEEVLSRLDSGESFEFLLDFYGGGLREPISFGRGNSIGLVAFELPAGGLSNIIKNNNGSFSIVRVERFLEEEVFSIDNVYSQIEQKIIKRKQEEVKMFLLDSLLKKYDLNINYNLLGL